jgi:DNA-directed RNA polymerase specialized sigma subunit
MKKANVDNFGTPYKFRNKKRDALIMSLYKKQFSLREISERVGISKSRVFIIVQRDLR